jgi:hypothetical protein
MPSTDVISVDELAGAIVASVEEYTHDVEEAIPAALDEAARETVRDLRARSPRKGGDYAKGWTIKKLKSPGGESRVIYNRTRYMLTHLLELGHAKVSGGRVSAIPHIAPVAEAHGAKLSANLARLVVRGGRA